MGSTMTAYASRRREAPMGEHLDDVVPSRGTGGGAWRPPRRLPRTRGHTLAQHLGEQRGLGREVPVHRPVDTPAPAATATTLAPANTDLAHHVAGRDQDASVAADRASIRAVRR